jgi:hypothetical protein
VRIRFRCLQVRSLLLIIASISFLVGLLLGYSGAALKGVLTHGAVCNKSSTAILVLFSPRKLWNENVWLAPGDCTHPGTEDVDGIWGKYCVTPTGGCQLQLWKVGPYSINITDRPEEPEALGHTLLIYGWCLLDCGWIIPTLRLTPNLDDLHYELRR